MGNPQDSKSWAGYFLLLCVTFVLGLFLGSHGPVTLINSILTGIGLVGLWGYLSQKAIGWRLFWAVMFVMQSLGTLAVLLLPLVSDLPLVLVVIVFVLTSPLLLALFRYAFRSPHIWLPEMAGT